MRTYGVARWASQVTRPRCASLPFASFREDDSETIARANLAPAPIVRTRRDRRTAAVDWRRIGGTPLLYCRHARHLGAGPGYGQWAIQRRFPRPGRVECPIVNTPLVAGEPPAFSAIVPRD